MKPENLSPNESWWLMKIMGTWDVIGSSHFEVADKVIFENDVNHLCFWSGLV